MDGPLMISMQQSICKCAISKLHFAWRLFTYNYSSQMCKRKQKLHIKLI